LAMRSASGPIDRRIASCTIAPNSSSVSITGLLIESPFARAKITEIMLGGFGRAPHLEGGGKDP
jgi:hypothetical protein